MSERLTRDVDFSAKEAGVSDPQLASALLDEVIGYRGVREPIKSMLERAYAELRKRNSAWTRRRVRAVFNKEANRIDYREIEEMLAIIQARKEHAEYKAETARIASLVVVRNAPEDRGVASK